ncbi:hypothetical protein TWF696_005603 [Orbilia brochopaga]|uniref:Uncharacterized protein n=1 Tax=Orbilia brochopaga TaxID=3140254 RepID=A0AAV9V7Y1_9PEZI
MSGHKKRLSVSGLVPPQQPSTPVGSDRCPSPADQVISDAPNGDVTATIEHEGLIKCLQGVRNCVSKLEKFDSESKDGCEDAAQQAAKILLELVNETNQVQNLIAKSLCDYSKFTDSPVFLKKERLEEFITRYNCILSILLEMPSHIRFGLKTNLLSHLPAAQGQWYRKDLERKLAKCDDIRAEIEAKIHGIEGAIEEARSRPSDDNALPKLKKVVDGSAYDTRPKRFNTARY